MGIGEEELEDVEEAVRTHPLALSIAQPLSPQSVQFYRMTCPPL